MNYDEIDVEKEVRAVDDAMERGAFRPATKKENMALRLAALSGWSCTGWGKVQSVAVSE